MKAAQNYNTPVAIIGMGCFFPNALDLKNYWRLLFNGEDCIKEVPETHWSAKDYYDPNPQKADYTYCKRGGFLPSTTFDPMEFGIPPNTMEATDTSQLFGLMAAKIALEDAGYGQSNNGDHSRTSVILGVTGTQELVIPLSSRLGFPKWRRALEASGISPEKTEEVIQRISEAYVPWQENSFPGLLGNVVPGRIANRLNLGGSNFAADAACASSMSGIHLALMELITGRSDMVVTGGVDTLNDIFMHMCFASTGILSSTGDARPFSKNADGTVLGEGVGIVIMKRLDDAEQDGDRIYAVIKSVGVSSDGKSQSIYAPNAKGQLRALRRAYDLADVDPATVELVEAHGTGTRVGDRVELQALTQCFDDASSGQKAKQWCALGAVKSMIGHTKAAAGSAGLIKAALALHHKVLPPTIKADRPDPDLKIETTPFYLNTETRPWFSNPEKSHPRRCGVSAFGFGGSNFHVVLEEHQPAKELIAWHGAIEIMALSASTPDQLIKRIRELKKRFNADSPSDNDIAREARQTRSEFNFADPYRLLMILERQGENTLSRTTSQRCDQALEAIADQGASAHSARQWRDKGVYYAGPNQSGKCAFLFPGQGSQYVNMGRDLACVFPQVFQTVEKFNAHDQASSCLSTILFPRPTKDKEERQNQENDLRATEAAQPALGAMSASMLKLLAYFGVTPDAVGGHSYGELSALYAAGWIDEATLIRLSYARGAFMQQAGKKKQDGQGDPNGSMLAIKAPLDEIEKLISEIDANVVLANCNSPNQGVVSGDLEAIETVARLCRDKNFGCTRLPVAAAFHSHLVKDAQAPFEKIVGQISITPTDIPVYANTTGRPYPMDEDAAKRMLGEQLSHTVDFITAVERMYADGVRTFVEVGPRTVLAGLVQSILKGRDFQTVAADRSSGRHNGLTDWAHLLCHLASLGLDVNLERWEEAVPEKRKPQMRVAISGANYVRPRPAASSDPSVKKQSPNSHDPIKTKERSQSSANAPVAAPEKSAPSKVKETALARKARQPNETIYPKRSDKFNNSTKAAAESPQSSLKPPVQSTLSADVTQMNTRTKKQARQMNPDAISTVREGLKAMQALQTQTAQTHQAFLETQTQASRTLEQMIASVQALTGDWPSTNAQDRNNAVAVQTDADFQARRAPDTDQAPNSRPLDGAFLDRVTPGTSAQDDSLSLRSSEPSPPPQSVSSSSMDALYAPPTETMRREASSPEQSPNMEASDLTKTLLEVVSELTGYPQEMLDLDMDIEADLGIDSIKRVEILSAMEAKDPNLPPVSPEIMGELHTLKQIVDHLNNAAVPNGAAMQSIAETKVVSDAKDAPDSTVASALDTGVIMANLMEVVSELTGYPPEMLEPEMDIEADLGIDSIKRVEILSAMEEKQPNLPAVSPERMGELKTLGQIAAYLDNSSENDLPSAAQKAAPTPQVDDLTPSLLEVVSELTGYPTEMLELDMDIEADLGIDSIKRVEILSALEEKHPDLPAVSPEMMGELKTLAQIVDYLKDAGGNDQVGDVNARVDKTDVPLPPSDTSFTDVERRLVQVVELPPVAGAAFVCAPDRTILVTDDGAGVAQVLVAHLEASQNNAMLITPDEIDVILKDQLALPRLAGLIILAPQFADASHDAQTTFLKNIFALVKYTAQDLADAASDGNALLASVTRLDGAFGFNAQGIDAPMTGALAGLIKTAALEWENVRCRALDVAPQWRDDDAIAQAVAAELFQDDVDAPIEVGLAPDRDCVKRLGLTLNVEPFAENASVQTGLGPEDVILISGGARGVTAEAAKALGRHTQAKMILLGRSPNPETEPVWLQAAQTPAEMKKALLENLFDKESTTPAQLEKAYRAYQSSREINTTLNQLAEMGAQVQYVAVDVRDRDAVFRVIQEVHQTIGPVSGLIHAAGVLEDRLIVDKSMDQFETVFETKTRGFINLIQALEQDPLKQIVIFSSVAGRMGNQGQVDYAMANEALNKMAWREAHRRENACKVSSLNWGPWDGGMVSPELKKEFTRRNIQLIPLEAGALCLLHEMSQSPTAPVEVVLGAGLTLSAADDPAMETQASSEHALKERDSKISEDAFSLAFKSEVDIGSYPILKAHVLDGAPVVPFALMAEWIGHSALHDNPGLLVHGFDEMRLLQGLKLDHGPLVVRLFNGDRRKNSNGFEVPVEIRDGAKKNGADRVHTRAKAVLTNALSEPPTYRKLLKDDLNGYSRSMDEVYNDILFHGVELRGIKEILGCTPDIMVARIIGAPPPEQWIQAPLRSRWLSDPLILDSAFQMAIIWCHDRKGLRSLPVYSQSFRQYRERFPEDGVTAALEIRQVDDRKMIGDFTFLDDANVVVARLTGYEAIMDASLANAFRNNCRERDRAVNQ